MDLDHFQPFSMAPALAGNCEAIWPSEVGRGFPGPLGISGALLRGRVSLPWRAELLLEAIQRAGPGGARLSPCHVLLALL
jgi:hypothetical protein